MKLHVCFFLSFWAAGALANKLSGPYQTMFVWYAYRLDILATNQDPSLDATKRLAAGCIGNNRADRTCDFDELLTYIQKPGLDAAAFTPPTRVGSDLNPDIEDAVKKIMASGYSNNVDENKLLPNSGLRPSPTYHEIFDKVTDRIQLARRVLGENPAELASVRYSAAMIHYKRLQDSAKYHIPGINKKLNDEGASWQVETKTVEMLNGEKFQEIDFKATILAHLNDDTLLQVVGDYVDSPPSGIKSHIRTAMAAQIHEYRVNNPDNTC